MLFCGDQPFGKALTVGTYCIHTIYALFHQVDKQGWACVEIINIEEVVLALKLLCEVHHYSVSETFIILAINCNTSVDLQTKHISRLGFTVYPDFYAKLRRLLGYILYKGYTTAGSNHYLIDT